MVQLSNIYDKNRDYKKDSRYIMPKLDWIRCIIRDGKFYSRTNKEFTGLDHIEIPNWYEWLDGELYSHGLDFNEIQSIVMNKQGNLDKSVIEYHCFNTSKWFTEHVNIPYSIIENNHDLIIEKTNDYIKDWYEWAMLWWDWYDFKRSNNLLKVKFFKEDDFKITWIIEGKGKYVGMLWALSIEWHWVSSEVGTGFTDIQREQLFTQDIIGVSVEVKYQWKSKWSLRFPVFNKLKLDR